jgi:hypothetical protein
MSSGAQQEGFGGANHEGGETSHVAAFEGHRGQFGSNSRVQ